MDMINEKDGLSQIETEALFAANKKSATKFPLISKIKNIIDTKKSEKILKDMDVCRALEENQR